MPRQGPLLAPKTSLVRSLVVGALVLFILYVLLREGDKGSPVPHERAQILEGFDDDGSYGALVLGGGSSRRPLQPNEMCSWETAQEARLHWLMFWVVFCCSKV